MKLIKHNWQAISKYFLAKRNNWLLKRIPRENSIKFTINNTFILPSSFGWSCIGIVICLFILGTNFQNNIILLLCYFLLAMVLLALFHSYFFFVQHTVDFLDIAPEFENRKANLPIQINSTLDYQGGSLTFSVDNIFKLSNLQNSESYTIKLPLPAYRRGYYKCPTVKIVATYGFGLFTCWTYLTPKLSFYVYPALQKSTVNLFQANSATQVSHSRYSQDTVSDDLQGVREHKISDPIHHISWKHVAKGQGMLTKDFTESKGVSGWLRLHDLNHLNIEQALRCLCYQVQQLSNNQLQFGLDLGSTKILPQEGDVHLHKCLVQLAMYEEHQKLATSEEQTSKVQAQRDKAFLGHAKLVRKTLSSRP
jgi:uncharacterized protein (DUF58 family)